MRRRILAVTVMLLVAACTNAGSDTIIEVPTPTSDADTIADSDDLLTPAETTDPATTTRVTSTTTSTGTSSTTLGSSTTSTTSSSTTTIAEPSPPPRLSPCPPTGASIWVNRPASDLPAPPLPDGWRSESAGTSAAGRDLTLLVHEVVDPARTVVVIGGIHGNEPASPPSVRAMVDARIPDDTEVWLLPTLNPDGSAAGTRCNANGVDLNRNFGFDWRPSTGGPGPFSEPEPSTARDLIARLDPDVVVWVHQPLDYVSSIGDTPDAYEQAWSAGSGLPVRPDVTQHGGGETWTALSAGVPAMLIEMSGWEATRAMVDAQVRGFEALLDVVVAR